jgi:hypothetical protein
MSGLLGSFQSGHNARRVRRAKEHHLVSEQRLGLSRSGRTKPTLGASVDGHREPAAQLFDSRALPSLRDRRQGTAYVPAKKREPAVLQHCRHARGVRVLAGLWIDGPHLPLALRGL